MYKHIRILAIFVLVLAFALSVPLVKAELIENWHLLYRAGVAHFDTTSGCIGTSVNVNAVDRYKQGRPIPQEAASQLYVTVTSADTCTGELLISVWEQLPLPHGALKISGHKVELHATVQVMNTVTEIVSDINLDLQWRATGEPRIVEREFIRDDSQPSYKNNLYVRNLVSIPAAAVGTVMFEGENRTPDPATDASIDKNKYRSVITGEMP